MESHASMLNLSNPDAKLQYIRNWQALQDFGITYFLVKVGKSKKEVSLREGGREKGKGKGGREEKVWEKGEGKGESGKERRRESGEGVGRKEEGRDWRGEQEEEEER